MGDLELYAVIENLLARNDALRARVAELEEHIETLRVALDEIAPASFGCAMPSKCDGSDGAVRCAVCIARAALDATKDET